MTLLRSWIIFFILIMPAAASSGTLSGSMATAASGYNLTSLGTADWIHWGRAGVYANVDRMANGNQLSTLTVVGKSPVVGGFATPSRSVSWINGTPTTSDSGDDGYIWSNADASKVGATGFSFTVPADTTTRTLYVYAGGYGSTSQLTAHLSDGSSANYVAPPVSSSGTYTNLYTITYSAASAGQTLLISYVKTSNSPGNATNGSADLIGAWLAGSPSPTPPKTGSLDCLVWVPFPNYNNSTGANSLDTQSMHDSMVTQMNTKLASLQAQGCSVPPPVNGTDGPWYTAMTPSIIGDLKQAHQYVQGMGTWWEQQSTSTGSIQPNALSGYQAWVSTVTSNSLIPHLSLASGGASDPSGVSWNPSNPTAAFNVFKNYAVNMVKAFPQITYWTLMNEIDACPINGNSCSTDIFGGRATGSAAVSHYQQGKYYAQFLSIVVPAMKAVNPKIKVANAGSGGLDVSPTSFWQGVADAGGIQYLDVFNVHVYGAIQYRVLDQALMYRTWLDHVGKTDMPMIMSEWGYLSNTSGGVNAQLAAESAAYADLKKYGLFLFDEVYAWDSTDGYAIAPSEVPNATERWFMANP